MNPTLVFRGFGAKLSQSVSYISNIAPVQGFGTHELPVCFPYQPHNQSFDPAIIVLSPRMLKSLKALSPRR